MSEAIASQLSGGAGRVRDYTWPPREVFRQNGAGPNLTIMNRIGAQNPQGAVTNFSTNPNTGYNANINGRSGATIGATVAGAGNGYGLALEAMVMNLGLLATATGPDLALLDEYGAARVKMIAFFSNVPATLGTAVDNGLELCCVGNGLINDGCIMLKGTPGLGFRVYDTNKVEAIMRPTQAGAVTRVDLLTAADGYRPDDWHCYEIRIIAAHGNTNAVAKFFIDGVLKLTMQWGPGNIMPQTNVNYAGFKAYLQSTGGSAAGFAVDSLDFHVARNELNLL